MSVGLKVDRNILDQRIGSTAVRVRDGLADAKKLKQFMDDTGDTALTDQNGDYRYTPAELTILKNAFLALSSLADIANGTSANPATYPYLLGLSKLTGIQ